MKNRLELRPWSLELNVLMIGKVEGARLRTIELKEPAGSGDVACKVIRTFDLGRKEA